MIKGDLEAFAQVTAATMLQYGNHAQSDEVAETPIDTVVDRRGEKTNAVIDGGTTIGPNRRNKTVDPFGLVALGSLAVGA